MLPQCRQFQCRLLIQLLLVAGSSPLSPVLKSVLADNEQAAPIRGRAALMHRIEARFRFLAVCITCPADGVPANIVELR